MKNWSEKTFNDFFCVLLGVAFLVFLAFAK